MKMRIWKRLCVAAAAVFLFAAALVGTLNLIVVQSTKGNIHPADEIASGEPYDCILILGCAVKASETAEDGYVPSGMLEDRLFTGLALYESGIAPKILVSGDHGSKDYDEVNVMKNFLTDKGVPAEDIFMDHAGFSTYESVYRAKAIFGAERIAVVTQQYHLYRAVYIAESLGLEAAGVSSDLHTYRGQSMRDLREIAARTKDVFSVTFRVKPKFLGEPVSLAGDGDITNDK